METAIASKEFQTIAREHLVALYSLARRLIRDDAVDLVQETLLRAYRSFEGLRDPEAAGGWLRSILVNVYRDRTRKQARRVEEVPVEDVDDFSLYRTLVDEDPFPYSDIVFARKLEKVGFEGVSFGEMMPFGIEEVSLSPLFTDELVA